MRLLNRPLGRLSRHRRGPVAGLLVVLLGLLLTGGLYAAFSPASAAMDDSAAQVKQGRELFLVGCSFCHGSNGQGVKTLDGNQLGPSLAGVGAAAVDFQVGTGRMPAVAARPADPAEGGRLHPRRDRRPRGVRRLAGPRPRDPQRGATTASPVSPTSSARRRSRAAARSS